MVAPTMTVVVMGTGFTSLIAKKPPLTPCTTASITRITRCVDEEGEYIAPAKKMLAL
ncbi:hypothetical protein PF008_g10693 [Phytophthora fragariae]|uniref:Uncharacterized protein n=1 Tax=Phytophthora fragariae TaxID=53985 RepID=A0A6G0RSY8_9STRA|nr:hypothetical protein PF008_g10693 [Phytophthora fragariae]